jgi:hypothetical protein
MLHRIDEQQQLQMVNMLIRALSDEMAQQQSDNTAKSQPDFPNEIEEALYELRLRKLLISAMMDTDDRNSDYPRIERRKTKRIVM